MIQELPKLADGESRPHQLVRLFPARVVPDRVDARVDPALDVGCQTVADYDRPPPPGRVEPDPVENLIEELAVRLAHAERPAVEDALKNAVHLVARERLVVGRVDAVRDDEESVAALFQRLEYVQALREEFCVLRYAAYVVAVESGGIDVREAEFVKHQLESFWLQSVIPNFAFFKLLPTKSIVLTKA